LPCPSIVILGLPKACLKAPGHIIPEEVCAEGRDQQIHRLHDLRGISVFFDCTIKEGGEIKASKNPNYRNTLSKNSQLILPFTSYFQRG
jgi:hypothetical protein